MNPVRWVKGLAKPFPEVNANLTLSNGAVVAVSLHEHPEHRTRESVTYHWRVNPAYMGLLPLLDVDIPQPEMRGRKVANIFATGPDGKPVKAEPGSPPPEPFEPRTAKSRALLERDSTKPVSPVDELVPMSAQHVEDLKTELNDALDAIDAMGPIFNGMRELVGESAKRAKSSGIRYLVATILYVVVILIVVWF